MGPAWTTAAMWRHLRSIRAMVWLGLYLVVAIALAFLPLFNVLDFEFAFAFALLGSMASADLAAAFVRRARKAEKPPLARASDPGSELLAITLRAAAVNLSLLLIPLAVISLNAMRVRNCDWAFGMEAYFLMPCLSSIAATGIGVLCALAAGERRGLSNALPYLVLVASLCYAGWRFYTQPPVFSYNIFVGYYPGTIYDEGIAFSAPFYWSRAFQLSLLLGGYAIAAILLDVPTLRLTLKRPLRPDTFRIRSGVVAALALVIAATLWVKSGTLGFDVDSDDIQEALGARHETENFIIYYPPGTEIGRDIEFIAQDHEFRLAQLVRILGAKPRGKITSYYFATAEQKFRLIGARNVYLAKPWRREIYLQHLPFPHQVLRHEIAHVVAGEFGDPVFRVSVETVANVPVFFNVGLIEGTAVAADWPDHRAGMTPHQSVKAMMLMGMNPPVDDVLSTRFMTFSAARSYTLAGSFVRYLLDLYGADRVRVLYRTGGDFMAAYGRTQRDVVADWRAFIDAIELPDGAEEVVRETFRRPGILTRPCPHAIARMRGRVSELLHHGRNREAVAEMRDVCSAAPHEPSYRLELAAVLLRAGARDEAIEILAEIAGNDTQISSSLRAQALLRIAGEAVRGGDMERAREILARASKLPLDENLKRNVVAQAYVLDHSGPAGEALRAYFWKTDPAKGLLDAVVLAGRAAEAVAAEPRNGVAHYLFGRNLSGRGAPAEATRSLARALDFGLPDALLVRECARLLAKTAFTAGDDASLERAAGLLKADGASEVARWLGAEWLERAHWRRTGELPAPLARARTGAHEGAQAQ